MAKIALIITWIIFFHSIGCSALSPPDEINFSSKNETSIDDSTHLQKSKEIDFSADVSGGLGFGNAGIAAEWGFSFDIERIMFSFKSYTIAVLSKQEIKGNAILLGYRIRKEKFIFSIAAGIGGASFKCTSGLNFDCYNYVEEKIQIYPVILEYDFNFGDNYALGISTNHYLSKRESNFALLLILKVGIPRGNLIK